MGWLHDAVAKPDEGPATSPEQVEPAPAPQDVTPDEMDRRRRYLQKALDEIRDRCREMREAAVDNWQRHDGRYKGEDWDSACLALSRKAVEVDNSLGGTEAVDLFLAEAPRDGGFTDAKIEEFIRRARDHVGARGREIPPAPEDAVAQLRGGARPAEVARGDDEGHDTAEVPRGASWGPADLASTVAGVLSGTVTRPAPTVGRLDNGRALFYRGRVNGVAGHSNAGKSWTAFLATRQELEAGEHVVFVDLEDDMPAAVMRLTDLGTAPETILDRFHYVSPDEAYTAEAARALTALLDDVRPSLVVIDSTGEALAVDGVKPNEDDEVARWFRRLPTAVARRSGAAVLVLDHVIKSDDGESLWPIGSQRKRGAITGAQYMQANLKPFSRGTAGRSKLVCAKDRGGNYAERAVVGHLEVTPTDDGGLDLVLSAPTVPLGADPEVKERQRQSEMAGIMRQIVDEVAVHPGATTVALEKSVTGRANKVRSAIRRLVAEGHLTVETGPRNAHLHHPGPKPFALDARVLPMVVSATEEEVAS